MSWKASSWARKQVCPPTSKLLLLLLADHASPDDVEDEVCWPSVRTLAREMGTSVRTVQRHLQTLQLIGLIERTSRHRYNGSRTSDLYRLIVG